MITRYILLKTFPILIYTRILILALWLPFYAMYSFSINLNNHLVLSSESLIVLFISVSIFYGTKSCAGGQELLANYRGELIMK